MPGPDVFAVQVPEGATALVEGPASVLCRGACRVFGAAFHRLEVPPYKRYPVEGPSLLELEGGRLELVPGRTVPPQWDLDLTGVVAVVGPTDSGKSSLATYLVNRATTAGRMACVVDADVGQSDVGPPGFAAFGCTAAPVPHISAVEPEDGHYVGSVNLQGLEEVAVAAVARLLREARSRHPHLVVINTPGWTVGRGLQLLRAMVDAADASVVQLGDALLDGLTVPSSPHARPRSPEERRHLRQLAYRRFLSGLSRASAPLDALKPCAWRDGLSCPWGRYMPADVERPQREGRDAKVPPQYLRSLLAGLYRRGRLVGYGIVERIGREVQLLATTADFDAVWIGKIRVDPSTFEELDPLP